MKSDEPYKFVSAGLSLDEYYEQRKSKASKILKILQYTVADLNEKNLLDIGCHEGTITKYLAPSFKSTVGIDIDKETIDIAQKLNGENIEFVSYNGNTFPFEDNIFDVLVINHVIYYVQNQQQFLKEVYRVLKPRGTCYLSAINVAFVEPSSFFPKNLWSTVRRKILKSADDFGWPGNYNQYLKLFNQFEVEDFTLKLLMHPQKYAIDIVDWQKLILLSLSKLPVYILKIIVKLSPTYIFILHNLGSTKSKNGAS